MKTFFLALATLTFTAALHAQVPPGTVPPALDPTANPAVQATVQAAATTAAQVAVQDAVNPAVQAAVQEAVDSLGYHKYAGVVSFGFVLFLFLSRVQQGRSNKLGWFDAILAAINGTNVPNRFQILIACLALLLIPSCTTMQKIGASLTTPKAKQVELALTDLGLHVAVDAGKLSSGDALTIGNGVAVITSGDTTISKVAQLTNLGLDAAVSKGLVKPGDSVLIKATTAVITQAIAPATPPTPPAATGTN